MPIAALPEYMGKDFSQASPGLRFGMYFQLWNPDFSKPKDTKEALKNVTKLSPDDIKTAASLKERQAINFEACITSDAALRIEAVCVAPFTTGLGNEHPLENGFAFLSPYGLPYLPGSGVKGVLRRAANELASGQWDDSDWSTDLRHEVHNPQGKRPFDASDIDVLFGSEARDGENHLRGVLSFWDVIPQIEGNSLMVDIMTPHQTHYYQPKLPAAGSTTPHDSGSPIPISFLTVPPGSGFAFHVVCDSARLQHLAPDLAANGRWKVLLTEAFEHAFAWLGFGAKTAVGYGAMKEDESAAKRRQKKEAEQAEQERQQAEQQARETARQTMSPAEQHMDELLEQRPDKTWNELTTLFKALDKGSARAEYRSHVAQRVKALMETGKKWKPTTEKKNPAKDNDHQDTLKVLKWLQGG